MGALRIREKAHTREGDAIAAARRRLPMVEMDPSIPLIGVNGAVTLLDAFEGRQHLIAYYFMWHTGHPAPEQCEGCTWDTSQVRELSYIHSRDVTYATFCQGPYDESARYRDFMGWEMPWYSAPPGIARDSLGWTPGWQDAPGLLPATRIHGVEVMDNSFHLLDLTVYGRREKWEDSPAGWPQHWEADANQLRTNGRPIAQWPRLAAGRADDLGTARAEKTSGGSRRIREARRYEPSQRDDG